MVAEVDPEELLAGGSCTRSCCSAACNGIKSTVNVHLHLASVGKCSSVG